MLTIRKQEKEIMQSAYLRNKETLELLLSGKNYRECAAEYETSVNSIMSDVRYVLEALEQDKPSATYSLTNHFI